MCRVLLIHEEESTEDVGPLKRGLREKYHNDGLPIYTVGIDQLEEFMKDAGVFTFVFYEKSLNQKNLLCHFNGNAPRFIEGLSLKDKAVDTFISSL